MALKRIAPTIIPLALIILIFVVFWQVSGHQFINFDDPLYVYENDLVRKGLSWQGISWAFSSTHASNWHPLTWLSHMLDCQLFDLQAGQHHLVNVLYHQLNTLLLYSFLFLTTNRLWQSAFVAALFAVHPLHVESVAWISERKDVLSTCFFMILLNTYVIYVRRKKTSLYLAVCFFFVLGLMSKPMLVTVPFLLLLLDFWPLKRCHAGFLSQENRWKIKSLIHEKIPLFGLAVISCIITWYAQTQSGALKSLQAFPLKLRIFNAVISYPQYLIKTLFPFNLSIFYPYPEEIAYWQFFGALFMLGIISFTVFRNLNKRPWLAVGWLWFLGSLVPVIGFVQVGMQSMADRYSYIPLVGIFIIAAWRGKDGSLEQKSYLRVIAFSIIIFLAVFSWQRAGKWHDSISLFRDALENTENNYIAHNYLALAMAKKNQLEEAADNYRKALEISPVYSEAQVNLGVILANQGNIQEALELFMLAAEKDPDNPKINNNIGNIHKNNGELILALKFYKKALDKEHNYKEALFNLANTYEKLGDFQGSIKYYNDLITLDPSMPEAYNGLGVVLARSNRISEAFVKFQQAIQLKPGYEQALKNHEIAKSLLQNKSTN